ncbi:AAA family ATPase [Rathayibacter sp. VKM Ac-2805]|uniref:AAA family ATPase n=1 Tax=Rathayibacter sp. VKM Ac-2805 TaxID=2609258 RepID=UPI001FC8F911|nr:AAA family ATPase [Rathayibacter sp. VKM Ac-2805]
MAGDRGISTENTAEKLHEHRNGTWNLTPGRLLVVDEASPAGTLAPDTITPHAQQAGAKVTASPQKATRTSSSRHIRRGAPTQPKGEHRS